MNQAPHPCVWWWQTSCLSAYKEGNDNNEVVCSISPSFQSQFTPLWLPSFWPIWMIHSKGTVLQTKMTWNSMHKCLDPAAKSFAQLACSHAEVEKVCLYNERYFVKNYLNFVKDVRLICANFIVIIITVCETKMQAIAFVLPLACSWNVHPLIHIQFLRSWI